MSPPRFAFVVHALSGPHQRVIGLRRATPRIALGIDDGAGPWQALGRLARFRLPGVVEGDILAIPLTPEQMLGDQERALARMERVVRVAERETPYDAVGLGSLCAVVAGRGTALQERLAAPVTTGAAATAWAQLSLTRRVLELRQTDRPVAIIGSAGPVGRAIASLLCADGRSVRVDSKRGGRKLSATVCASPEEAVAGCDVIVGAGPTGGTLDPAALEPGATLVDVALPDTLTGPPPPGTIVVAGEAVTTPPEWDGGFWGPIYQIVAGYGPQQVFACLVEPLVLALSGRGRPYAQGRRLDPEDVADFGQRATALGFRPRLAVGWRALPERALSAARR